MTEAEGLRCPTCGQPMTLARLLAEAFRRGLAGEVPPKDWATLGPGARLLIRTFVDRLGEHGDVQDQADQT
jgi:hypothetical protein